jgi:N-methylhydantoinase A
VYFHRSGHLETTVVDLDSLAPSAELEGPAIVQSPITTIVVDPGARARRTAAGSIVIETGAVGPAPYRLDELNVTGRA